MTGTAAGPGGMLPDAEKTLSPQTADDMPNKVELQEPQPHSTKSSDKATDANLSEKSEDAADKEGKGSMGDYFVSGGRKQAYCNGLIPSCSDSESFDMRTAWTLSCMRSPLQVLSWPVLLCR